jgi:hypothetical protein
MSDEWWDHDDVGPMSPKYADIPSNTTMGLPTPPPMNPVPPLPPRAPRVARRGPKAKQDLAKLGIANTQTRRKVQLRGGRTFRLKKGGADPPTEATAKAAYDYSRAAIDKYELKPVIVNPASRFVVATYWWGRGKLNANMTRPCPEVHTDQIKEEIFEDNIEDDPSLKEFNKEYVDMKKEILAMTDEQLATPEGEEKRKKWIVKKALFNVYRQQTIDNEKKQTPEQLAMDPKDEKRKSKFTLRLEKRLKEPPYMGTNRNLEGTGGIKRQPIALEAMIQRWESSMIAANCNYISQEYPEFVIGYPKYYQSAINAKPLFIKKALEVCQGRTVLYIDGDMLIHQYPKIFDMPGVDFFAQGWVTDPRTNKNFARRPCFDPYIFETSGGMMAYANTKTAMKLLDGWSAAAHTLTNFGKAEDRVLSMVFTRQNMVFPVNIIQLPIEYLWLTDKYVNFDFRYPASDKTIKIAANIDNVIIEHPECLTPEESAKDQGAAEDRSPVGYNKEVTDRAVCTRLGGDFYERIFFSDPDMIDSFRPYLDYMKNAINTNKQKMFNIIPWDEIYGEYTVIASKNILSAKDAQPPLPAEDFVVVPLNTSIPVIIYYLHNSKNVYLGEKIEGLDPEIQAAATNIGPRFPKRYVPEIALDLTKPMFFSYKSRVVGCLLRMCENLQALNTLMNSSYMFVSRIRWAMTQAGKNAPVPNAEGVIQLPVQPETAEDLEIRTAKMFQAQIERQELEKRKAPRVEEDLGAIPKKVHQIWFGGEIPAWRQYLFDVNKVAAERNGYTYRLWQNTDRTRENFVSTIAYQDGALEHGKAQGQSRWAQVADLARIEILYNNGGVYLDSLFETGDDFFKAITRLSLEGKAFIGCNEDPCELECGANGKKYLSNSFIATMKGSPVMERLLNDTTLGNIDLDDQAINQTTGPYYLRTGIVDPVADKVFLFKTEEIYPFPMSGSVLRPPEPNPFLLRAPSEDSIETTPGMWLQKGALQLLQAQNRPVKPLALYHVGLGGTWST